jgi:hypothetical protein
MTSNPKVYLEIEIDEKKVGRIIIGTFHSVFVCLFFFFDPLCCCQSSMMGVIELFMDVTPITAKNFLYLCTGNFILPSCHSIVLTINTIGEKGIGKNTHKPLHYRG